MRDSIFERDEGEQVLVFSSEEKKTKNSAIRIRKIVQLWLTPKGMEFLSFIRMGLISCLCSQFGVCVVHDPDRFNRMNKKGIKKLPFLFFHLKAILATPYFQNRLSGQSGL
jgi:hypothetical protein